MASATQIDPAPGLRHIGEPLGAVVVGLDRAAAAKAGKTVVQTLADQGGWEAPEHGSERYLMLEAALASRGMGWRFRGGEGAHDNWSLVRDCARIAAQRDMMEVERETADWSVAVPESRARMAFTQWGLGEVRPRHASPGDVLLFSMGKWGVHPAIMSAPGGDYSWSMLPRKSLPEAMMVHGYYARSVVESWLGKWWSDRLIGAFSFDTADRMRALKVAA